MPDKDNLYWIFFDTSTIADYYLDVHNVLSLPPGFIVRYNYRKKYLSDLAIEALTNINCSPQKVLFVYSQLNSYKRGEITPNHPSDFDNMLWVPFRTGELVKLSKPSEDDINFDLQVGDYPDIENNILNKVLREQFTQNNTPYKKWVIIAEGIDTYNNLIEHNGSSGNYIKIINKIGSAPSQFAGDGFWKIHLEDKSENEIRPLLDLKSNTATSYYNLKDDTEFIINVESHTPPEIDSRRASKLSNQRNIIISSSDKNVIDLEYEKSVRQYTEFHVNSKTKKIIGFGSRKCTLKFETKNGTSEYFIGPEFLINFEVSHKIWEVIFGITFAFFSIIFYISFSFLPIGESLFFIIPLAIAIVLAVLASYLLTRGIKFIFK